MDSFLGPDIKAEGEVKSDAQLYQNQIAKTLTSLLGLKYINEPTPGEAISGAMN